MDLLESLVKHRTNIPLVEWDLKTSVLDWLGLPVTDVPPQLLPVESESMKDLEQSPYSMYLGADGRVLRKLITWARKKEKTLEVLNPAALSVKRRQGLRTVPTFAVFNLSCEGRIDVFLSSDGLFYASWPGSDGKVYFPRELGKAYRDAFSLVVFEEEASFSFTFKGIIPEEQKSNIQEVRELGLRDLYLIMEVPKGAWQVNSKPRQIDILDPLLVGRLGEQLIIFDVFDLTDAESYIKKLLTTRLTW